MPRLFINRRRAEALRFVFDLAFLDQQEYIFHGHPERDHGEQWPAAAARKAHQLRIISGIAAAIGEESQAQGYDLLAAAVIEHAQRYHTDLAERQRRCQAPAFHRGPDRPLVTGEWICKCGKHCNAWFCECGIRWDAGIETGPTEAHQ